MTDQLSGNLKRIVRFSVSILIAALLVACGSSDGGDAVTPTSKVNPVSGSSINGTTLIQITFSTSMDYSELNLTGSMAPLSDGGMWSTVNDVNDTLTIRPATLWSDGLHTLTVDVKNMSGTAIDSLNLNYQVDASLEVLSISPGNNAILAGSTLIVITYGETMESGSLNIGGSLSTESGDSVWSTTTFPEDTLTISPVDQWLPGDKSLTITVNDLAGNTSSVDLNYTVGHDADGDSYLAEIDDCDDANPVVNPGQTGYFTTPYSAGFDYDCSTVEEKQYPDLGALMAPCFVGWDTVVAQCGSSGTYITDTSCSTITLTQACH